MDYIERRKIFNKMVTFMRQSGVKYKAFHIEKKHIEDIVEATGKLSKQISVFIRSTMTSCFRSTWLKYTMIMDK